MITVATPCRIVPTSGMASFSSVTYGLCALFHNSLGTNRVIRPLNNPGRGTGGLAAWIQANPGIGKFALDHAETFVGGVPATLFGSAICSRESAPRYVCAWK